MKAMKKIGAKPQAKKAQKTTPKAVPAPSGKQEQRWLAEDDARTLMRAEEIKASRGRLAKAKSVAREQAQYGKCHVRTAARSASRNHFGTRPAASDGIERQRQIGIVLVGVVALNFKVGGGIDQRTTRITHRVGIPHIHVAAQAGTQ